MPGWKTILSFCEAGPIFTGYVSFREGNWRCIFCWRKMVANSTLWSQVLSHKTHRHRLVANRPWGTINYTHLKNQTLTCLTPKTCIVLGPFWNLTLQCTFIYLQKWDTQNYLDCRFCSPFHRDWKAFVSQLNCFPIESSSMLAKSHWCSASKASRSPNATSSISSMP